MAEKRKAAFPFKAGTLGKAASNHRAKFNQFRHFWQLATVFLAQLLVLGPAIPSILSWLLEVTR